MDEVASEQEVPALKPPPGWPTGRWGQASWSKAIVLPEGWAKDTLPVAERGPFVVIHADTAAAAEYLVALLNREAERSVQA